MARDELLVRHPPWRHDLGLQQGQDDVCASEDERSGPVEAVEDSEGLPWREVASHGKEDQQFEEQHQRADRNALADRHALASRD